jgi:hypothetical protein
MRIAAILVVTSTHDERLEAGLFPRLHKSTEIVTKEGLDTEPSCQLSPSFLVWLARFACPHDVWLHRGNPLRWPVVVLSVVVLSVVDLSVVVLSVVVLSVVVLSVVVLSVVVLSVIVLSVVLSVVVLSVIVLSIVVLSAVVLSVVLLLAESWWRTSFPGGIVGSTIDKVDPLPPFLRVPNSCIPTMSPFAS